MRWSSEGFVLSLKPHNEKSYILEVLTREHGKHKGLIRGVHSKNLRSIIEPGNEITAHWSGRLETHLGNYSIEGIKSWSSLILAEKEKLFVNFNSFKIREVIKYPDITKKISTPMNPPGKKL